MSAPTPPYDSLGLDAPFAQGYDEADRYEAGPTWSALGESPYAEATQADEAWQEATYGGTVGEERLAWLDVEAEGPSYLHAEEHLALDGEQMDENDEHECELEDAAEASHEWERAPDAAPERDSEYLDDEERDAAESYLPEVNEDRFEPEYEEAIAPLTAKQRAWVLALDASAIGRIPNAAVRDGFLQRDWSDVEFPGNVPRGQTATAAIKQHWSLARSLFNAMAGVVPERRVPSSIRFRDRPTVKVPGQPSQRLYAEASDAFVRMHAAAKADGVELVILSSWRSRARQAAASANQPNSNAVARKASAHMYGLAIDVRMGVPGLPVKEINTRVDPTTAAKAGTSAKMGNLVRMYRSPVYKWLSLRAREFGWFPYRNEPWHWEYNPPGLKARFESATRGESKWEHEANREPASWQERQDESPYAEAGHEATYEDEFEDEFERAAPPNLRTFTARALDVKVAVYVTQAARTASEVELMVFAHGLDLCKPVLKDRPASFITQAPFKLGECVEASGRPIVLVVPFLDWERLAANDMAYGRKWHRLAQPDVFNRVAAEALDVARTINQAATPPSLKRVILAGHSRAYGFFDALAHEHASPQMRTGALSRPLHVWALDTTYSAPIADWRAWLRSRQDLQATVVFRHGTYRTKGSTVPRELSTGVRGREFAKLAKDSGGRLTAVPVPAGKVSHCAIPSAWLPRLLATLPPLATFKGESETVYEDYDLGEDEAGLATEAEAGTGTDPAAAIVIDQYPRYAREMTEDRARKLDPLIAKIVETVKSGGRIEVSIVGHADFDAKGRAFETKVSVERADAAAETLMKKLMAQAKLAGLTPEKVLAALDLHRKGIGTRQAVKPRNDEDRRRNRRVEFSWKSLQSLPPLPPPDDGKAMRVVSAARWAGLSHREQKLMPAARKVLFVVTNRNDRPASIGIIDLLTQPKVRQSQTIPPGQTVQLEFRAPREGLINEWPFILEYTAPGDSPMDLFWEAWSHVPPTSNEYEFETNETHEYLQRAADEGEELAATDVAGHGEWTELEAPGRFDALGDQRDTEWNSESSEDLSDSFDEDESPMSFEGVHDEAAGLSGSGLTPAERKAVEITSLFETGKRGGFYGLSGNFDGQGLSFGLVNWTIGTGSLQPLLRDFAKEHPARWVWAFGADAPGFLRLIARKDKQAQKEQHRFAIETMNSVSVDARGKRIWTVRQPWVGYFKRLSEDAAFQGIQVRYVRDLLASAADYCRRFGFKSEQAFCFMFDAVSSHGKWWLRKKFDGVEKRRVLVEQALAALAARHGGRSPEGEALLAIADVLAATSAQRWADKVRRRKRWFVTGQHPRGRELDPLRPRNDLAFSSSGPARREAESLADASEWEDVVHRSGRASSGGDGAAPALVTGSFEPFVGTGRVDRDIAHILNVMDGYPAGSWTKGVARFLLGELGSGRLSLIVKNSMVNIRIENVPEEGREITREVARDVASGAFPAMTATYGSDGSALILSATLVRNGTQPGPGRGEAALKIAHESAHIRNRTRIPTGGSPTAGSFVDVTQAESLEGMRNRDHFMGELVCNHVAWRVRKEIDNKWDARPIPAQPALRAFFKYALELADNGLVDAKKRYLKQLGSVDAGQVSRQVGLWVRDAGVIADFGDGPLNATAKSLFRATFDAASPAFAIPFEPMDGGIQSW